MEITPSPSSWMENLLLKRNSKAGFITPIQTRVFSFTFVLGENVVYFNVSLVFPNEVNEMQIKMSNSMCFFMISVLKEFEILGHKINQFMTIFLCF